MPETFRFNPDEGGPFEVPDITGDDEANIFDVQAARDRGRLDEFRVSAPTSSGGAGRAPGGRRAITGLGPAAVLAVVAVVAIMLARGS